jgi:hypothetical protein
VNLDCGGTPENVWQQLLAIGRLMRPAASLGTVESGPLPVFDDKEQEEQVAIVDDDKGSELRA